MTIFPTDYGDLHINDNPKLATLGSLPSILTTSTKGRVFLVGNGAIPLTQVSALQSKFLAPAPVAVPNSNEVEAQGMQISAPEIGSASTSMAP